MGQHYWRYCATVATALTLGWAGSLDAAQRGGGGGRAPAFEDTPEILTEPVEGFIKLPEGLYFGEGIGVAENSQGHVFVYTRSDVVQVDPTRPRDGAPAVDGGVS